MNLEDLKQVNELSARRAELRKYIDDIGHPLLSLNLYFKRPSEEYTDTLRFNLTPPASAQPIFNRPLLGELEVRVLRELLAKCVQTELDEIERQLAGIGVNF